MAEDFIFKLRDKPKKKEKTSPKERLFIVIVFFITIILSLLFWLKTEVSYWWQNWEQPAIYHIER